jgi:hypothetical protein
MPPLSRGHFCLDRFERAAFLRVPNRRNSVDSLTQAALPDEPRGELPAGQRDEPRGEPLAALPGELLASRPDELRAALPDELLAALPDEPRGELRDELPGKLPATGLGWPR